MSAFLRRKILIDRMVELESSGLSCKGCPGTCCTFEANSMMVTPLEAWEIFTYLKKNKLLSPDLKRKLEETKNLYRLEHKPTKGRSYLRKSYTCPFFNHQELGCPLPREIKPYGCLAFNAHDSAKKASEYCFAENEALTLREETHKEETEMNEKLKAEHSLYWDKSPIPTAVLDIWERFISSHHE